MTRAYDGQFPLVQVFVVVIIALPFSFAFAG
jgi:hypothetical protein